MSRPRKSLNLNHLALFILLLSTLLGFLLIGRARIRSPQISPAPNNSLYLYQTANQVFSAKIGRKNSNTPFVSFTTAGGGSATFDLLGSHSKGSQQEGNTVTYPDIFPDTNLSYTTLPNGIKEEIVLTEPTTQARYIFNLNTSSHPRQITASLYSPFFFDDQDNYQFHLEKPFAVDAKGVRTEDISLSLRRSKDQPDTYQILLAVSPAWLSDPTRAYPVTIDPTILHDTTAEFVAGTLNRLKDTGPGATATLESYYQELPADVNTVGLWHLNEASGNALDSSGNGNTGVPTGATVVTGLLGNARSFNGTSDYLATTNAPTLGFSNAITVEAWIYPTTATPATARGIISRSNASGTPYGFDLNLETDGRIRFWVAPSDGASVDTLAYSNRIVNANVWNHVVGVVNGTSISVYINGVEGSKYLRANSTVNNGAQNIDIGRWPASGWYFPGSIDEVRISNIARTPEEIKSSASRRPYSIYTSDVLDLGGAGSFVTTWNPLQWSEHGVNTGDGETLKDATSLVAQWNFNETSGTTADNAEGTAARDLTLSGFDSTASQDADPDSSWTANNKRWGAGALKFDGADSFASCTDANCGGTSSLDIGTRDWSTSAWIKTSKTGAYQMIASKGISSSWELAVSSSNQAYFYLNNTLGANYVTASSNKIVTDGNWHFVVGTWNVATTTLNIYVDGKLENTDNTITGTQVTDTTADFAIGRRSDGYYFNGAIDSVSIYSRALGAAEIMSNYQAANVEFQTRVGADTSPDDGSWSAWSPTTGETQISSLDNNSEQWQIDGNPNSSSTISKISAINTGTGNDDICIIDNGTKTLDTTAGSSVCNGSGRATAYAVNFSDTTLEKTGETSVTVSATPTGITAGDEILIINLQGTSTNYENVGKYETHIVSSVDTNTLNFTDYPLVNTYDGTTQKIMVQRVPNFGDVTVCGGNTGGGCTAAATVTATAWNGTKGGVLFFRSTGTTTLNANATITAAGLGYRTGTAGGGNNGKQGESINGTGAVSTANNLSGGGGGSYTTGCCAISGGGGGYSTSGKNGSLNTSTGTVGTGGTIIGENSLGQLYFGGGGGEGGPSGYPGRAGGGIIGISAETVTVNSSALLSAKGLNSGGGGVEGGAGAGGSISLSANTLTLGSSLVTASGGTYSTSPGYSDGGPGRITAYYTTAISGSTSPTAYTQKLQSIIKQEGTGAFQIQTGRPEADSSTVGLWHLDETGGTGAYIKDSTANANHGTPTGTTVVNGIAGKALGLNGTSDYITVPDSTLWTFGSGNFSMEFWLYDTGSTNASAVISIGASASSYESNLIYFNANTLYYYSTSDSSGTSGWNIVSALSFGTVPTNKWTHFAITRNGSTFTTYQNGVQQNTASSATASYDPALFYIGRRINTANFIKGRLDELKISNTARTYEEIAESYRAGRDHYINKTISSTDLSGKSSLPFYVAADRPGSYLSATIGESAYANYQSDANTVGLWHLDEQSGSGAYIKDTSGNSNHGTPTGTTFTQGRIGKARSFNGTSDYATISDSNSLDISNNFTISLWFNPSVLTQTNRYLLSKLNNAGSDNTYSILWEYVDNTLEFYSNDFTGTAPRTGSSISITDTNWHHIVYAYNGTTWSGYKDGVLIFSTARNFSLNASTGSFFLGAFSSGCCFVNGSIDEVRVDNIARTADEIRQAYEVGLRTHPITIDFGAKLDSGDLLTGSGDLGFTVDATYYGLQNKGDQLFKGDKIIVKENYDGTEYIAQGTVDAVTASTGATTVSAWDSGSTFPSGGYTVNASVFKWQREYWNPSASLGTHRNAITNLSLRLTDGAEGRTIWLDDLRSTSGYLTDSSGSTITSSTGSRYMQYRAILSSFDEAVSATLSAVTVDYVINTTPPTPTLDAPTDTATNQLLSTVLKTTATDADSDYLRYKIELCTDLAMTLNCQTFDQTSSQTGWSGQDAQTSTAYTSGTQATYTLQTPLSAATTYYWRSYAIDPAGINTWSSTQTPYSFTTTAAPTAPTIPYAEGASNPTGVIDITPEFSAIHNDPNADAADYYEIDVNTASDFTGTVMWASGELSMASLASGARSTDVSYAGTTIPLDGAGTTYYWRIRFTDVQGATGAWSATQNFTMNALPATPSLDSPTDTATNQTRYTVLKTTATDADSDYLRYKILLCTDLAMTLDCQTFDQTSSQTGWSGQNAQTSTAYTSGTQGVYTIQTPLSVATTYYWVSYAIDPGGSNTWSSTPTPISFTTLPNPPTPSACTVTKNDTNTEIVVNWLDNATTESGYQLWRVVDGGVPAQFGSNLAADIITATDSTISSGHAYGYLIRSFQVDGASTIYSSFCSTAYSSLGSGTFMLEGLKLDGLKLN